MATRGLKILMVCPQFFPTVGGYERAALRLSGELVRRGHHVVVLTERRKRSWPARESVDDVAIVRLPVVVRRGLHGLTAGLSLACSLILRTNRADIVHVHQPGWFASIAIAVGRVLCTPVIVKVTNTDNRGIGAVIASSRLELLSRKLHCMADAWLATSERGREELEALGVPNRRIHNIPNGIDVLEHHPQSTDEKRRNRTGRIDSAGLVAIFAGRLTEQKDPMLLLEAWPEVLRECGDATLVLLGDGPLRGELRERAVALGIEASVEFAGRVEDPVTWIAASDLFVLCSKWEGLSNSLLEALACGVPVVSTEVSGSVDVFQSADVGELVPVGEQSALAAAIVRLLCDPERRTLCGARARALAESDYSLESVAERVEGLYRRLIGRVA